MKVILTSTTMLPYRKILLIGVSLALYLGFVQGQAVSQPNQSCSNPTCCTNQTTCDGHCEDGYYGDNCTNHCPTNCQKCEDTEENMVNCTQCEDGFHGDNCTNHCPANCQKCEDTEENMVNCTQCEDGFHGDNCTNHCPTNCQKCVDTEANMVNCTQCEDGFHGENCTNPCPTNCQKCEDTEENMVNCTQCEDGFHGDNCTNPCPANCKKCEDSEENVVNCTQCEDGFHGDNCTNLCPTNCQKCEDTEVNMVNCTQCEDGFYGDNCTNPCPTNCQKCEDTEANMVNCTQCEDGFHGDNCTNPCPTNCQKCEDTEENMVNCTQCEDGFHGDNCTNHCPTNCQKCEDTEENMVNCTQCEDGFHGDNCTNPCPANCQKCEDTGENMVNCTQCEDGFHGDNCTNPCPANCKKCVDTEENMVNCTQCEDGFHGDNCTNHCPTNCQKCEDTEENMVNCTQCEDGFHGDNCTNPCPANCKKCEDSEENMVNCTQCEDGFHGDNCTNPCPTNCQKCEDTEENMVNCTQCEDGFHGDNCTNHCPTNCQKCEDTEENMVNCTQCEDGFHGDNCTNPCPTNCQKCEDTEENMVNCTQCEDGFHGDNCTNPCPTNCQKCEDTEENMVNCTQCEDDFHGDNCTNPCPTNCQKCVDTAENMVNCTQCEDGFHGDNCTNPCPANCVKCVDTEESMVNCTHCIVGFHGENCLCPTNCDECINSDTDEKIINCTQCKNGFHGDNCTNPCPANCQKCVDTEENMVNCTQCKNGYYSTADQYQCQQQCSGGCNTCINSSVCIKCGERHQLMPLTSSKYKYCLWHSEPAPECNNICSCCSVTCDADGKCGQCTDGYHGGECRNKCPNNCIRCEDASQGGGVSNCTLCKDGYYSTPTLFQCQQSCPACKTCDSSGNCTSCRNGDFLSSNDSCDMCNDGCSTCTSTENCTDCIAGYYLDGANCTQCSQLCSKCSHSNSCICAIGCGNDYCDALTGICKFGCKDNFELDIHKKCDSCIDGLYGPQCNKSCDGNCTTCDRLSGNCTACESGYFGDYCDKCHENCKSSVCNQTTGMCHACDEGFYGDHCKSNCSENCQICEMTEGYCTTCIDGFYGDECDKNCSVNCLQNKCDKDSGNCTCKHGYVGDTCNVMTSTTKASTTPILTVIVVTADPGQFTAPAVGGTLGGLVVIGIMILLIVLLLRRRVTYKYPQHVLEMDSYKLDPSLIDVLEENDEFDPTYFTGIVDDTKKPCGKLPVKELAQFVDSHGVDYFQEEFLKLPRGLIKSCDDAKKDDNIVKNRYTGIYPYDDHRVRLLPPGSDFINACYIDGFMKKKEYIASLGPTIKAMEHFLLFWRMVWQEKTDVIVMVTNLMEGKASKCEQYWPNIGTSSTYGDITVTSQSEKTFSEYVVKMFLVSRDGEQRELHHVHYTAWPDKRVPDDITSLIEFRQKVKSIKPVLGGPIIVHCSAGIGRTGTYIALDILINQGKAQKALDIFDWVTRMREQRTSMVQTWEQYDYLHRALVHALTYHCDHIKAKKFQQFMDNATDKRMTGRFTQLEQKKERMTETEQEARQMNSELEDMNRQGADIPGNQNRPFLHLDKKYGESNYINAIYVNSYTVKNRFLIAQTPLPKTVKDFLTLITQETCSCVVSMDPPGLQDATIGEYFSTANESVFTYPSYVFEVETQELDSNTSYTLRRLTVHFNKRSGSVTRTLYHYQCRHWPQGNRVPNITNFLQLVQDVEALADRDTDHGPVIVHCLNAAGRSGLFCAVSNLIQKMRLEGEVSVVNTLRQIKVRRQLAIPNKEQYIFCHQCVLQYVNSEKSDNDDLAVYDNV